MRARHRAELLALVGRRPEELKPAAAPTLEAIRVVDGVMKGLREPTDEGERTQFAIERDDGGLPSLKAVFSADTAAIEASDVAKKAAQSAVLLERTTGTRAGKVFSGLRAMLLSNFGAAAVAVLGDFGVNPPKSKAAKTVVTKAVGVAKAKATRVARGTKGPVARTAVVGTVDAEAIKSAINSPAKPPTAPAEPAAAAPAAVPAPASPAPTPATPGTPRS
jgi:hypothetical protein